MSDSVLYLRWTPMLLWLRRYGITEYQVRALKRQGKILQCGTGKRALYSRRQIEQDVLTDAMKGK